MIEIWKQVVVNGEKYENYQVSNFTVTTCPLYPFRLGKNPFRKNNLTDEQRDKMRERMKQLKNK